MRDKKIETKKAFMEGQAQAEEMQLRALERIATISIVINTSILLISVVIFLRLLLK